MSRREKRKEVKKLKRKQLRQRQALQLQKEEEEALALDPSEVLRQQMLDEQALAKEKEEHAAQEKLWLLREEQARLETHRKQEEEAVRKLREEEWKRRQTEEAEVLEDGWEYVEDGPAEIIWNGNEIIVNKPRRKVWRGGFSTSKVLEDKTRATSNPLPPQSTAFSTHQLSSTTAVTDQSSTFGTEQDKRNCPFYLKTGVCRFGVRCSRMHPIFNEKACTLLMRSMYNGAGLAFDDLEGLEYTDEEVTNEYEDFYDDVHPEFLQFGEIINFKVCRNGSPHLRGNLYVHYLSDESAMAAYNSINGRFFAKKQITCEFVGVTKWRAAICGEYMKANYKPCSHGTACNFMHVFQNPRGEYDWADWDKAPPWHWQKKMARMFGGTQDSDEENSRRRREEDWKEGAYEDDNYYSWRGTSLLDNHSRRSQYHSSRKSRSVDRHRRSRSRDRHQSSRHRRLRSQDRHRRSRSPDRHRRSRSLEHHIPRSSSQERLHSSSDEREDRVRNAYEKDGIPFLAGSRSRQSRSRYGHGRPRSQSRYNAQRLNSRERYHSGSDEADDRVTTGYTSGEGSRTPTGGDGKRHSGLGSHDSYNGETTRGYSHSIKWRGDYDKAGRRGDRYFSRDPKNSDNREHRNRRKHVSIPEDECSPCSSSFADGRWKMNGDALLGERGAFALKEPSSTDLKFERDLKAEDGLKDGEQLHVAATNGDGLERYLETGVSMALNLDAVQESTVRWLQWKHLKPKTTRQATCEAFLE